jgi:hypothetical protein
MEPFTASVFQAPAWIWNFLLFTVAACLTLALLSAPAYLIFYPIIRRLHEGLTAYLRSLETRQLAARQSRAQSFTASVDEFRRDSKISVFRRGNVGSESAIRHFTDLASSLKSALSRFAGAPSSFQRMTGPLLDAAAKPAPTFPEIPTPSALLTMHSELRTAKMRLIVSSVILLALISVNTGMLGQILRDLGFIPHDLVYFGVPLYLVFAFILTLAESGLGYVHTAIRPPASKGERISLWPAIAVGLAMIIACVEGFFYSQVAPSKEGLISLPGGYEVRQTSLFFLWGAALVMVLFGLGVIWSTSLELISESAQHFPGLVRQLERNRERFAMAIERADKAATHFQETIQTASQTLVTGAESAKELMKQLDHVRSLPSDAEETFQSQEITRLDARYAMHQSGLWFGVAIAISCVTAALSRAAMVARFPHTFGAFSLLVGLVLAAVFVVMGALLAKTDVFLTGAGTRRTLMLGSDGKDKLAVLIGILLSVLFLLVLWRMQLPRYASALWLTSYVGGVGTAASVGRAVAASQGLSLWVKNWSNVLKTVLEMGWTSIARVIRGFVIALETIALAFAAPIFLLKKRELPSLQLHVERPVQAISAQGSL